MTSNTINAQRVLEERRHNIVTEKQTDVMNRETQRHNLAFEAITKQGNYLSYNASIYGSNMHLAGVKYSADRSYQSAIYSANLNARTQRDIARINQNTQLQTARINAATQRLVSQQRYDASLYQANLSASTQRMTAKWRNRTDTQISYARNNTEVITAGMKSGATIFGSAVGAISKVAGR